MVEDSKSKINPPTYDSETGAPKNYDGTYGHRKSDPRLDDPTLPETPIVRSHPGNQMLADVETHKLPTVPADPNDNATTNPVTPVLPETGKPKPSLIQKGQPLKLPSKPIPKPNQ